MLLMNGMVNGCWCLIWLLFLLCWMGFDGALTRLLTLFHGGKIYVQIQNYDCSSSGVDEIVGLRVCTLLIQFTSNKEGRREGRNKDFQVISSLANDS